MYIEFNLPKQGQDSQYTCYALSEIQEEIQCWLAKYPVSYKQKTIKYKHRLTFEDDYNYTLFALTWNPKSWNQRHTWINFRVVSDLNNKI
jgi:hypothetical protein